MTTIEELRDKVRLAENNFSCRLPVHITQLMTQSAAELEALTKEVEALKQQVALPLFTKRVVEERDQLRFQNRELREALQKISDVSISHDLTLWCRDAARKALAQTEVKP